MSFPGYEIRDTSIENKLEVFGFDLVAETHLVNDSAVVYLLFNTIELSL